MRACVTNEAVRQWLMHVRGCADEGVWNLYTWGSNARGQLGHGDTVARKEPTALRSVVQRVVRVAAGHEFTLFTMDNGAVCGCGRSDQGQLGDCVTGTHLVRGHVRGAQQCTLESG